jgi:hypothetical protein
MAAGAAGFHFAATVWPEIGRASPAVWAAALSLILPAAAGTATLCISVSAILHQHNRLALTVALSSLVLCVAFIVAIVLLNHSNLSLVYECGVLKNASFVW